MNHHINNRRLNSFNTDGIIRIAACMADTILKPLYDYVNGLNLVGYIGSLDIICEWAKEFYQQYFAKMEDWDTFEESDENIYNATCWDDFLNDWANDRFKQFKAPGHDLNLATGSTDDPSFSNSKTPKLIIIIKNHGLASVYSNIPVRFAQLDYDNSNLSKYPLVGVFEPDTIAHNLITLFDQSDPLQQAIQEELINQGF